MRVAKIQLKPLGLFGAENETEAGKAEDQINTGSDVACKRPQPIASVLIIGMHHRLCKRKATSRGDKGWVRSFNLNRSHHSDLPANVVHLPQYSIRSALTALNLSDRVLTEAVSSFSSSGSLNISQPI